MRLYSSPWGPVQDQSEVAPGIVRVSTAGHGGYYLSPERRAQMPVEVRAFETFAGSGWYEEDCDWAIVAASFPADFPAFSVYNAVRQILGSPDYFGALATAPEWMARAVNDSAEWARQYADRFITGSQGYGAKGTIWRGYRVRDDAVVELWWPSESCEYRHLGAYWTLDEARKLGAEVRKEPAAEVAA